VCSLPLTNEISQPTVDDIVRLLEAACTKALTYTPNPSFKSVKTILATGQEKINPDTLPKPKTETSDYGFTRGANYYGGYDDDK
jgi:hypothetical protein